MAMVVENVDETVPVAKVAANNVVSTSENASVAAQNVSTSGANAVASASSRIAHVHSNGDSKRVALINKAINMALTEQNDKETAALFKNLERLPHEVLALIFQMLPPPTLLLLQDIGVEWISRVTFWVKVISCADCPFISLSSLLRFSKPISSHITALYLDNLVFVKSIELCRVIVKCKHLKVLSVKNSGVVLQHLYNIFFHTKLHELSWTVINLSSTHPLKQMQWNSSFSIGQIKKITLEVGDLAMFHYFVRYLIPFCRDLVELRIDYSVNRSYSNVLNTRLGTTLFSQQDPPNLPYLNSCIVTWPLMRTLLDNTKELKEQSVIPLLKWLFCKRTEEIKWKKFWICDNMNTEDVHQLCRVKPLSLSSASCLFIVESDSSSCTLDVLKNCAPRSVDQLGIYVSKFQAGHVQNIQRACGNRLKQFSAIATDRISILMDIQPFFDMVKVCTNITDLDITGIHVSDHHNMSFCFAISVLKNLRRLGMPICAMTDGPVRIAPTFLAEDENPFAPPTTRKRVCMHNAINLNAAKLFTEMVQSCPLVEYFHLTGCFRCGMADAGNVFSEIIISDMCRWRYLKHLRIDHVPSLCLFAFLEGVAEHCDNFTSLHLANVAHHEVFHMTSSLLKVLTKAKNLTFFRVVHHSFNYTNGSFWDAVGKASNLQGMCIASECRDCICANAVYKAISELPNFHVFHLHCKSALQMQMDLQRMKILLGRKTGRASEIENMNLIFEDVHRDSATGFIQEPHCHIYHCGVKDTSVKAPYSS